MNANARVSAEEVIEPTPDLNDAYYHGVAPEGFDDFLSKEATFLTGEVWGAKDRRNTQDGDWKAATMPWGAWIGGAAGGTGKPAWGFSRHPVGKDKAGRCIVLGSSVGGARKARAMDTMYAMGLDIDSGETLDSVLDRLEELGLFALVCTTFSHGKRGLELKRDEVIRKCKLDGEPTLEDAKAYLREYAKSRYADDWIEAVTIADPKRQTKDGVVIALDTPPLDKFRLIFPLAEPVKLVDLAPTQSEALDLWEDKVTGLARNVLGVNFDTACTDPSRLFYTARHPKNATGEREPYCAIVQGRPITFDEIPAMRKADYTRAGGDPFMQAGGTTDGPPQCLAPSGASLNDWHRHAKERFMLADLLEAVCPDRIRVAGGEAQGQVHTECPFEHEHTREGGTATMAINALDAESGYWTWFCHHDACQGRHKLEFLEEALRAGWFTEDLIGPDGGYMLPFDGDGADPLLPEEEREALRKEAADDFEADALALTRDNTEAEIRALIGRAFVAGVDLTQRGKIIDAVAKNTTLTKNEVKAIWKELDEEKRHEDRAKRKKSTGAAVVNEDDFHDQAAYAARQIEAKNADSPFLFQHVGELSEVRTKDGVPKIKKVSEKRFAHLLNSCAKFVRVSGEGNSVGVSAPFDVVNHLLGTDLSEYPALHGVASTPFFDRDGNLVVADGYHEGTGVFLRNGVVGMAGVSPAPSDEEVADALSFIVEEVLADFPLGKKSRHEIMEGLSMGELDPAVSSALSLLMLPFMRDMIDGPTPGHLFTKPTPGTGASLLMDVVSIIATGRETPALAMPTNKEEMSKTLTSVLSNGQNIVFFDNINHDVDSGELASAMTTPVYQARLLSTNQTVEVAVRCVWSFTGNTVSMSSELVRRLIVIPLDARVANPELRTDFRHENIRGWVTVNRAEIVHAVLTIIRNWVAKGQPKGGARMGSYDPWAWSMSGVLEAAGVVGFLTDQDDLRAGTKDTVAEGEQRLMDLIATYAEDGNTLRMGKGGDVSIRELLNGDADGSSGYDHDMIAIRGWGYTEDGYSSRNGNASKRFRDYVKGVREGRDAEGNLWQLEFAETKDSSQTSVYTLKKTLLQAAKKKAA